MTARRIAHAAGVNLTLEDFTRVGKRTPVLADLKPSGKFMMSELVKIGGTVPLMKMLVEEKLMNGDCLTVTAQTMAPGQRIGVHTDRPLAGWEIARLVVQFHGGAY